jgi:asparaginyl-tRNA synthetase
MGDTYTFGPSFRAEVSHTKKHLSEFWMIEPELAFADLVDLMANAESYVKYCLKYVLDNNKDDLEFLD